MKARKRNTNDEWKEIDFVQLKDSYIITKADQMEFDIPSNTKNEESHWQDVRERAAIAAMQGVMNFFGSIDYNKETIAKLAVEQADALIKELKRNEL